TVAVGFENLFANQLLHVCRYLGEDLIPLRLGKLWRLPILLPGLVQLPDHGLVSPFVKLSPNSSAFARTCSCPFLEALYGYGSEWLSLLSTGSGAQGVLLLSMPIGFVSGRGVS